MLRWSLPSILFLALCVPPLSAREDSLVGAWEASIELEDEGSVATRLVFLEDGAFELSSVWRTEDGYFRPPQVLLEEDLASEEAEYLNQMWMAAWPETPLETSTLLASGTWAASDSLRLQWTAVDLTYDDKDFTEFHVSFGVSFGLNWERELRAAQGFEFPEEDRLALEQELTTLYEEFLTRELLLAGLQETSGTNYYDIRDGGRVLVLEGTTFVVPQPLQEAEPRARPRAKPLSYRRIDVASAVNPATWGGVKSAAAP